MAYTCNHGIQESEKQESNCEVGLVFIMSSQSYLAQNKNQSPTTNYSFGLSEVKVSTVCLDTYSMDKGKVLYLYHLTYPAKNSAELVLLLFASESRGNEGAEKSDGHKFT
jgi:hypothetical protein